MNDTRLSTLDYIQKSGEALHAAGALADKVAQDQQKVAKIVPVRVDLLVDSGLIHSEEKQAAADQLGTHEGALAVVGNLIQIMGEQKQAFQQKIAAAGNGKPAPGTNGTSNGNGRSKQGDAGLNYEDGGYVGRRHGAGERSAADEVFIEKLGLAGRFPSNNQ